MPTFISRGVPRAVSAESNDGRVGREISESRRFIIETVGALLAWAFIPILAVEIYARSRGASATGAFSSLVAEDQFQYFTWIRQSGTHGAIANLFDTAPLHHVFVFPPFLLSGALWHLGLPLPVAYHLWTVVGAAMLATTVYAYMRRLFPRGAARPATIVALTFGTPYMIVRHWLDLSNSHGGDRLLAYVLSPLSAFWGYAPRLLAVAAMPLFFLLVEAAFVRSSRRAAAAAAAIGMLISWSHPWQGAIVLLVAGALVVWSRFDRILLIRLVGPAVGTLLPLLYYGFLRHTYSDWRHASQNPTYFHPLDVALVLTPFLVLAALGLRRAGTDIQERIVLLWLVATALVVAAPTGGRFESVAGSSIPLAVLVVRGWQRLSLPRSVAVIALSVAVLGIAVPLVADSPRLIRGGGGSFWLRDGDREALRYIANAPATGSVLADSHISAATVALTGRQMWAAHASWSPDYVARATLMNDAVAGRLSTLTIRQLVLATHARYLLHDCGRGPVPQKLAASLAVTEAAIHRFGCATVFDLGGSA